MRKNIIYILMLAALTAANIKLEAQGIEFRDLSFEEALRSAKQENKMLFIDCYTSWCFPCKFIAARIFPLDTVGTFFNEKFVSIKLDMEEPESLSLNSNYTVTAYPTFLIFSSEGALINKLVGTSRSAKEWLDRINEAIDKGNYIDSLRKLYYYDKNLTTADELIEAYRDIDYKEGVAYLLNEKYKSTNSDVTFPTEAIILASSNILDPTIPLFISIYKQSIASNDSISNMYNKLYTNSFNTLYGKYLLGRIEYNREKIVQLNSLYIELINKRSDLCSHYPQIIELHKEGNYENISKYITNEMKEVSSANIFNLEKQFLRIKDLPESFKEWFNNYCINEREKKPPITPKKSTIDLGKLMDIMLLKK